MTISKPFLATLGCLCYVERRVFTLLADMADAAWDPRLKSCFLVHSGETEGQISRLRYVSAGLGIRPMERACDVANRLIFECEQVVNSAHAHGTVKDAALASRGQALGHYEIARYRALIAWSRDERWEDLVDVLDIGIDEERNSIRHLASIAASRRPDPTRSAGASLAEEPD